MTDGPKPIQREKGKGRDRNKTNLLYPERSRVVNRILLPINTPHLLLQLIPKRVERLAADTTRVVEDGRGWYV